MKKYSFRERAHESVCWRARPVLGFIRHSCAREGIVLLCSGLGQPHLAHRVQFWALQYKKDIELLGSIQKRAIRMVKGISKKPCEEWLMSLGLFSPEKKSLRGDLIAATASSWQEEESKTLISSLG